MRRVDFLKGIKPSTFCGLVFGLLLSGYVLADCALDDGYKLPVGVTFQEHCYSFEDLAIVHNNDKFGFVDNKGNIIISLEYDDVDNFEEGLAVVWKDNLAGYVNKSGKVVIPLRFDDASSFF